MFEYCETPIGAVSFLQFYPFFFVSIVRLGCHLFNFPLS